MVNKVSPQMAQMHSKYQLINDLKGGADAIIGAGDKYLSRGLRESKLSFEQRLKHSRYIDYFNSTVQSITGLMFSDKVVYEDLDPKLQPFIENADSIGTHYDLVLSKLFKNSLEFGLGFILVDIAKGEKQSLADEVGIEPYATLINAMNVISYKSEVINGKTVLSQIVIRELVEEDIDEFETEVVEQFRVLNRGYYRIFRGNIKEGFGVVEEGETGLDYIPLFALNLDEDGGFLDAKPPLYELGTLCKYHYQDYSEMSWSLFTANVPIRTMTGITADEAKGLEISHNTVMRSDNENAKFSYWEYDPKAIKFTADELEKLRGEIAKAGIGAISGKSQMTATENVLDNIKTESKLQTYARKLRDVAELVLMCVADFKGMDTDNTGRVNINIKLSSDVDASFITAVTGAYAKGSMSLDTMYAMIQTGKMPDNFDIEEEKSKIAVGVLE